MIRCAIVLIAILTVSLNLFAQAKKGPLAKLPSNPGAHLEKIKAMGDNAVRTSQETAADYEYGVNGREESRRKA